MTAVIRIAFAVLLVASAAVADTITFNPPNPDSTTPVDAVVSGISSGCPANQLGISKSGTTITLRLNYDFPPDGGCGGALRPFTMTYHLGVLPDGDYTVIALYDGTKTYELARENLDVHNEQSFVLDPYPVPTRGGSVSIANPFNVDATSVIVGGMPVTVTNTVDRRIVFDAPAHGAGSVDVTIYSSAGTAKGTIVYYLSGSGDPAALEAVLFPLAYEGPGAFGSQWTTENYLTEGSSTKRINNSGAAWGEVRYLVRGTLDRTFFSSRVRDLSRQAESAGVEIPVVRERDFRLAPVDLLNVPGDARFRAMIRIWTTDDAGTIAVGIGDAARAIATTRIPGTALAFASLDITDMLRGAEAQPVHVFSTGGSPYVWAMISVTNNQTQEVTVISLR